MKNNSSRFNTETLKKLLQFTGICTILFVFLGAGLEYFFYKRCLKEGLLNRQYQYGRGLNPYYGTEVTPNFTFWAHDSLFKVTNLLTDSNSFVTDVPIAVTKPANTIRIILAGGSTVFGNIQNKSFVVSDNYPEAMYCYSVGIAGRLKQKLQDAYPAWQFEVINAGVPNHCLHETWQMYIAKFHAFKPDIVINMDGNNDGWSYFTGKNFWSPYKKRERDGLLDLEMKSREKKFPYSATYYRNWQEKNSRALLKKQESHEPLPYSLEDYKKIEPFIIQNSQPTLWVIASHEQQMRSDSVFSIRVLQPLLLRKGKQKALSSMEQDFVKQLGRSFFLEDSVAKAMKPIAYDVLNEKFPQVYNIGFGWFFDRYLAHAEDSIVRSYGGIFIDMNEKITDLKASDEFYVDYCHLTPFGNDVVAGHLMPAMDVFMKKKTNVIAGKN